MDLRIRPAVLHADAEALAAVVASTGEFHAGLDPERFRHPDPARVAARLLAAGAAGEAVTAKEDRVAERTALAAEADGVVVGYAQLSLHAPTGEEGTHTPRRFVSIDSIAVLPEHRGLGIGTRLVEAAIAWGSDRDAAYVTVDAHVANERVIDWYRRAGFLPLALVLQRPVRGRTGA